MKQKYHPYTEWEDYKNGMWRKVSISEEKQFLEKAIAFTGNYQEYGKYMMRVAKEWPIACEHNLTDISQNRRAWIGHAACCLAINCPEYITRSAWGYLSREQQDLANGEADRAIEWWELEKGEGNNAQKLFEF